MDSEKFQNRKHLAQDDELRKQTINMLKAKSKLLDKHDVNEAIDLLDKLEREQEQEK